MRPADPNVVGLRKDRVELHERAAVHVVRRDEFRAGLGDVRDREVDCRRARSERQRTEAALKRRKTLLQDVFRRIHETGVDVARTLQREKVRAMLGVVEIKGGRAVDGNRTGVCRGIAVPAGGGSRQQDTPRAQ